MNKRIIILIFLSLLVATFSVNAQIRKVTMVKKENVVNKEEIAKKEAAKQARMEKLYAGYRDHDGNAHRRGGNGYY